MQLVIYDSNRCDVCGVIGQYGPSPSTHKGLTLYWHYIENKVKDFFSKCDQIYSFLRIWSHLLKKSLMENFIFHAVCVTPRVPSVSRVVNVCLKDISEGVFFSQTRERA